MDDILSASTRFALKSKYLRSNLKLGLQVSIQNNRNISHRLLWINPEEADFIDTTRCDFSLIRENDKDSQALKDGGKTLIL